MTSTSSSLLIYNFILLKISNIQIINHIKMGLICFSEVDRNSNEPADLFSTFSTDYKEKSGTKHKTVTTETSFTSDYSQYCIDQEVCSYNSSNDSDKNFRKHLSNNFYIGTDAIALEQVFILCKTGVASALQFILSIYPYLDLKLNDVRECEVAEMKLELNALQLGAVSGHVQIVEVLLSKSTIMCNNQVLPFLQL